jgi:TonB family protein
MVCALAAEALETYLRLDPDPEEKRAWSEQLESLRFFGSSHTADSGNEQVFTGRQVNTRARVLKKPEPQYTERARQAQMTGTVALQAVFAADGSVKHILVVEGLPYGLTESSVKAARQIQFTPATFEGRPVSTFIQLEYNFNLY